MKHTLNTLYVTQPGSCLSKDGNTVLVERDNKKVIQLPIHTLGQIVCFGFSIIVTPPLMAFCAQNAVSIAWLTENGRFLGRVEGEIKGNVLLRRQQYRWADHEQKSLNVARCIVAAKVNNSRLNLQRFLRNQSGTVNTEEVERQIYELARLLNKMENCQNMDLLRGIEGEAANRYFNVFDSLITQQKEDFQFKCRSRRPPRDRVNALLSFVYTLLVFDIRSSLETVGLDPYVGFLHTDRPGRPSLALDMMEEFRAPLADRLVCRLVNLKKIQGKQFVVHGTGEVEMSEECRKELIMTYQNRKKEIIEHPFLKEKMEIGLIFQTQARLLARHIRGDLEYYPAFIWR